VSNIETERDRRNARSRAKANHDREPWSDNEIEMLREWFALGDLEGLAEILGRTVEACRQQYYTDQKQQKKTVSKKDEATAAVKKVDRWAKGFTSLEDMGY
jgi:hypothetical protein